MNIINKQFKSKNIGISIIVSSSILILFNIVALVIIPQFGLSSGLNILALIPFFLLTLFVLIVASVGIYIGIRYTKNNGFKKNESLGTILIYFGIFYFVYSLFSCIFSNLTGNTGGWLQPIIAFIWTVLSLPLGFALRNGTK